MFLLLRDKCSERFLHISIAVLKTITSFFLRNVGASLDFMSSIENCDDFSRRTIDLNEETFVACVSSKRFLYCNKSVITTTLSCHVGFYSVRWEEIKISFSVVELLAGVTPVKVTKHIYWSTKVQIWGTLLEHFHFLLLYSSAPLQFRGKYCTFHSTTFIWYL